MKIEDMLEKFNSLNEKAEELKALMKILIHIKQMLVEHLVMQTQH